MDPETEYRGYNITREWISSGAPQPDEFTFVHPDYDGPPDKRCGFGKTLQSVKDWIDEIEDEREPEANTRPSEIVATLTARAQQFELNSMGESSSAFLSWSAKAEAIRELIAIAEKERWERGAIPTAIITAPAGSHTPGPWRQGNGSYVISDNPAPGINGSDATEYYGGHLICESINASNAHPNKEPEFGDAITAVMIIIAAFVSWTVICFIAGVLVERFYS